MAKKKHEIIIVPTDPNVDPYEATDLIGYIVWTDVKDLSVLTAIRGVVHATNEISYPKYSSRVLVECDPRYDQADLKFEIFNALATHIPGGDNNG